MGAWSHEAFGNDDALDWVHGLEAVDDLSLLEAALDAVLDESGGCLEAPLATEALAAVELIARLRGHAGEESCPDIAEDWIARTRLVPPEPLVKRALAVLERIGGDESELKELWDESDSAEAWQASLADLRRRLLAPPQPLQAALDGVGKLLRGLAGLSFAVPDFPPDEMTQGPFASAVRPQLFAAIVAAEALGDPAKVREGIARMWRLLAAGNELKILWDLAVREAKTWAAEGRLDAALAGLAPWRDTAESFAPGTFDMRCMAVCQEAGEHEQAEQLRQRLIDAGQWAAMQLLDLALREARAGSPKAARSLLSTHAGHFDNPALAPWRDFALGILEVRDRQPGALERLTPWMEARVTQASAGPAVWPFLGIGAGWWALALHQAGRTDAARAALASTRPLLMTAENALLVDELKAAWLLEATAQVPALPRPPSTEAQRPGLQADHGVFKTVSVRGVNALQQVHALRRAFAQGSRLYPFLIGDAADLAALLESLEPPTDGGQATLAASRDVDAEQWLRANGQAKAPRWRDGDAEPARLVQTQFDVLSNHLKPLQFIGLVELDDPCELFARLGYGGWNDCPGPEVHVALHRHWRERCGADPIAISEAVVECCVARPPADRKAALALAVEQQAYCPDIVEQGVGTTAALAATLLEAPVWYFWWD
ncbi:hypothetical protein ASC95_01880 [Pelomonas sp. Root1217]|uniref:DUF4253 domain-containing protein n=1 Tax=Pelomonas sp. Root1217 TaxID=1736430 RepID=UPI00070B0509|nr:DUF4253 domain-containing protein [Pelomonas sp. Root1217]KQV60245.1 hypothetical protein ASC95_01880 [Pelomonas sp. Root1217]